MPSLLDYFQGLSVTATEIQQAETLAEQTLQAKYPDLDLRPGTGVYDLVIRPNATLLALTNKALNFYFSQNTIAKVDDTTSTEMVDDLLSNWFLYRNLGSRATINVRLYFARSKNITLTTNTYFSTDGKLKFYPISNTVIPNTALSLDTFQNEYYYDLELMAESAGTDYNISSGSLLYFSTFDPYFLHAEINYLSTEAGNPETNTQFLARSKNAISTRNLINIPSIISNIQAKYSNIANVLPIGYGDVEMIRDQVSALVPGVSQPVLTHIGGCVDVYCKTQLTNASAQFTTDSNGIVNVPGATIDVTRNNISAGANADTLPLTIDATASSLTSTGLVATFTSTQPHTYSTNDSITISGATPSGYNGTHTITVSDDTHFTFGLASTLTSPAIGTIKASKNVPYTVQRNHESNVVIVPVTVSADSLTSSSTVATFTSGSAHGLITGDYVTIGGATPAGYNGTYQITVTNSTTFTYSISSTLTSPATGTILATKGIISLGTMVIVWAPYHGFSAKRYVTVSGATPSSYNGTYIVDSVTRDTFMYTVPVAPVSSPATGSTLLTKQIAYNYDIGFTDQNTIGDSVLQVNFTNAYANKTVSLNMLQFRDIDNVQGYLSDPDYRVLAASINARGFNFYYLTINVVSYNGPSPDASTCGKILNTYIESLQPGNNFVMSDAISALKAGGITNIQTPLGISYKKYTRDMILPAIAGTIVDVLDPYDRTSIFYLNQVTTNNSSV